MIPICTTLHLFLNLRPHCTRWDEIMIRTNVILFRAPFTIHDRTWRGVLLPFFHLRWSFNRSFLHISLLITHLPLALPNDRTQCPWSRWHLQRRCITLAPISARTAPITVLEFSEVFFFSSLLLLRSSRICSVPSSSYAQASESGKGRFIMATCVAHRFFVSKWILVLHRRRARE